MKKARHPASSSRTAGPEPEPGGMSVRSSRTASSLALLLLLAVFSACGQPEPPPADGIEVLVLGLDGASWNLMQPMMERGALPNLQRMVDEGVHGPMRSELPCLSIVLWTSVATGKRPEAHGITGWEYEDPDTGEKGLMNGDRRQVEALWNMLSGGGRSVGFVNWWATWPAEPVRGYMVSEQMTRAKQGERLDRGTYPESLADSLGETLSDRRWPWLESVLEDGSLKVLSDRMEPSGTGSGPGKDVRYQQAFFLYGQDYLGERAAFQLLESEARPELFGYLSRKIDVASHYMWQFIPEEERDYEAVSRILEPVYRYEDALLGRLLAEAGPDTNVIVLSDHGFTWESEGLGHEETAPGGIFLAMGPAFERGKALPESDALRHHADRPSPAGSTHGERHGGRRRRERTPARTTDSAGGHVRQGWASSRCGAKPGRRADSPGAEVPGLPPLVSK